VHALSPLSRGWSCRLYAPDQLIPQPRELVLRNGQPATIAGWKALADGLLTDQPCVFHRNLEISSRYAWLYKYRPAYFKWCGMAAFASHHVRLALFPLRLDRDRTGYVNIPHSLGRRKVLLITDVHRIRETNNAIFDDIFWVHLAYAAAEDGIECLRGLLHDDPHYAAVLAGFESIDRGRRTLDEELVWEGNVALLEHEQRALVQPNLDGLSCGFARLFSIGSALSFEVRGLHDEVSYFTSFYYYALTRGIRDALHAQAWPRITRFDDRWRWIVQCIVPRFRRLDLHTLLVDASLRRVFEEARDYASNPCVVPHVENR
jgi:hypothetical protein